MKNNCDIEKAMELADKISKAASALNMIYGCDAETEDLYRLAVNIDARACRMVKMLEIALKEEQERKAL
jgi:hypothetical protein